MMLRTRKHVRRAAAVVELALLLPLLVFLMIGIWEVGRMVEVNQLLTNACREGGRQASTGTRTATQVKDTVVAYLQKNGISKVSSTDVTVENKTSAARPDPTQANQLDRFRITVSIPVDSVRWVLLPQLTNTTTLKVQVDWYSMRDVPLTVNDQIPLE